MWDLPGPGLKPVSPELAGGFLTTALPRKPDNHFYLNFLKILLHFNRGEIQDKAVVQKRYREYRDVRDF